MLAVESVHALPRQSLHLPSPSAVAEQGGEMLNRKEACDGKEVGTAHLPHNQSYIFITVIHKTLLGALCL